MKSSTATKGRLFVDTWGWLVLADGRDPSHETAVRTRREFTREGVVCTSDYVLDETFTLLFSRCPFPQAKEYSAGILEASKRGLLKIEWITPERFQSAHRLRLRYHDKPQISFTDLTSFVVMQELGIRNVLTADAHFIKVQLGFRLVP
jgi:predicted nucleic acid-binding protein